MSNAGRTCRTALPQEFMEYVQELVYRHVVHAVIGARDLDILDAGQQLPHLLHALPRTCPIFVGLHE